LHVVPSYLEAVGQAVRAHRERRGWSRRELAAQSGVSERFLAQLEAGDGNISLRRFAEVAHSLGTTPSALLAAADAPAAESPRPVALLGVRGAGKSTVGAALAKRLGLAFVELDREIELAAGLPLGEVFALHGEAYYRRVEREVLTRLCAAPPSSHGAAGSASAAGSAVSRGAAGSASAAGSSAAGAPMVLATGGSIVNDPTNYALLRSRCLTVWLRARPEDHWNRVVAQGDRRPMADSPHAFAELRALLAAREKLYARADHTIDTAGRSVSAVVTELAALMA
jgi:XRE family aerobic/anaerobic benzoate catabolism transcriptional regulator